MDLSNLIPVKRYTEQSWLKVLLKLLPKGKIWKHFLEYPADEWQDTISQGETLQDTISSGITYQDTIQTGWSERGSKLAILLSVFAAEFDRWWNRYLALKKEAVPGLSVELLPDWERVAGLPDSCSLLASTTEERQAIVHQKITQGKGDPTLLELTQHEQYWIDYAANLGYTITISYYTGVFRVGVNTVGQLLGGASSVYTWVISGNWDSLLQCLFERDKPAYTEIEWV